MQCAMQGGTTQIDMHAVNLDRNRLQRAHTHALQEIRCCKLGLQLPLTRTQTQYEGVVVDAGGKEGLHDPD